MTERRPADRYEANLLSQVKTMDNETILLTIAPHFARIALRRLRDPGCCLLLFHALLIPDAASLGLPANAIFVWNSDCF